MLFVYAEYIVIFAQRHTPLINYVCYPSFDWRHINTILAKAQQSRSTIGSVFGFTHTTDSGAAVTPFSDTEQMRRDTWMNELL